MRATRLHWIAVVVPLVGLVWAARPATAGPFGVAATACAYDVGFPSCDSHNGATSASAMQDFSDDKGDLESATATASLGSLGVRTLAEGSAYAAAGAAWDETIVATSTSLPLGSTVVVQPTIDVTATVTSSGDGTGGLGWYLKEDGVYVVTHNLPGIPDISKPLDLFVGGAVDLEGGEEATAFSLTGSDDENSSNTAKFFLDSMTPGVVLVSSSGHDYSTPTTAAVPEPSSLALVASAAFLLGLLSLAVKTIRKSLMPREVG